MWEVRLLVRPAYPSSACWQARVSTNCSRWVPLDHRCPPPPSTDLLPPDGLHQLKLTMTLTRCLRVKAPPVVNQPLFSQYRSRLLNDGLHCWFHQMTVKLLFPMLDDFPTRSSFEPRIEDFVIWKFWNVSRVDDGSETDRNPENIPTVGQGGARPSVMWTQSSNQHNYWLLVEHNHHYFFTIIDYHQAPSWNISNHLRTLFDHFRSRRNQGWHLMVCVSNLHNHWPSAWKSYIFKNWF